MRSFRSSIAGVSAMTIPALALVFGMTVPGPGGAPLADGWRHDGDNWRSHLRRERHEVRAARRHAREERREARAARRHAREEMREARHARRHARPERAAHEHREAVEARRHAREERREARRARRHLREERRHLREERRHARAAWHARHGGPVHEGHYHGLRPYPVFYWGPYGYYDPWPYRIYAHYGYWPDWIFGVPPWLRLVFWRTHYERYGHYPRAHCPHGDEIVAFIVRTQDD